MKRAHGWHPGREPCRRCRCVDRFQRALNRLDDAKTAYLALFSSNRQLAAQLLAGMQAWVGEHRGNSGGVDGASLESFASWVSERSAIASQTAGLTREGASAAW